jgi:hypothetical protein
MPNGGTQGATVLQHFCKFHQAFNVKMRTLKVRAFLVLTRNHPTS